MKKSRKRKKELNFWIVVEDWDFDAFKKFSTLSPAIRLRDRMNKEDDEIDRYKVVRIKERYS